MASTTTKFSCFAHNHLSPALYGVYKLITEISHGSGEFWVSSRGMERLFADVSKSTLHRMTARLIKSGWLYRIGADVKQRDDRGHYLPEKVRAVTHDEWVASHGSSTCPTGGTRNKDQSHGRDATCPTGGTLQSHGRDEVLDTKSEREIRTETTLPSSVSIKAEGNAQDDDRPSAPNRAINPEQSQDQDHSPSSPSNKQPNPTPKILTADQQDEQRAIDAVFKYYVELMNLDPAIEKFTPTRQQLLRRRLRELESAKRTRKEAVRFLVRCLDELYDSDFHMGRDRKTKGMLYNSLEQCFADGKFERWAYMVRRKELRTQ